MSVQMQIRRGTAAAWTAANPVLAQGEAGLETDTGKLKYGDGATAWSSLAYFGGSGTGTVTTVSVVSTNGFTGTVANPTTTPAITLTCSITGILKGNGTAISAAVAGTDYLAPTGSAAALTGLTSGQVTGALGFTPQTAYTILGTLGGLTNAAGVLTNNGSGGLSWGAVGGGMTNPMTTLGDVIYGGAAGAPTRLAGPATNGTYGQQSIPTAGAAVAPVWTLCQGTGAPVCATSPTLTTPVLGVATATSINKVTVTAPTTSATLTLITGSTLATNTAASLTLGLTSAATSVITMPSGTHTLGALDVAQTWSAVQTFTPQVVLSGGATSAAAILFTSNVNQAAGSVSYSATNGLQLWGKTGSANDLVLISNTGTIIMQLAVGATVPSFPQGVLPGISAPSWAATMSLTTSPYSVIRITLGGATTLNFSAGLDGQKIVLELKQDATGSRVVTWGTGVQWGTSPAAPTLTTTANKVDRIDLIYNSASSVWTAMGYSLGSA